MRWAEPIEMLITAAKILNSKAGTAQGRKKLLILRYSTTAQT